MTDYETIINFLDQQYEVRLALHHYVIVEKNATMLDNVFEIEALNQEVQEILGYESWEAHRACITWYNDNVDLLNKHFYDFIKPYKVEMTMVDWTVVDNEGKPLDIYRMFNKLEKYYEVHEIIYKMYEVWKLKKIIKYSEKRDDLFGSYDIK